MRGFIFFALIWFVCLRYLFFFTFNVYTSNRKYRYLKTCLFSKITVTILNYYNCYKKYQNLMKVFKHKSCFVNYNNEKKIICHYLDYYFPLMYYTIIIIIQSKDIKLVVKLRCSWTFILHSFKNIQYLWIIDRMQRIFHS